MVWKALLAVSVLAARACASVEGGMEALEAVGAVERRVAAAAEDAALAIDYLPRVVAKRAANGTAAAGSTSTGNGVVLTADGTINMTVWDDTVTAACSAALLKLPASSNPSGTCVCYNLPALDNTTGKFEADLRLFQLSTPSGAFLGIPPENINVSVSYATASLAQPASAAAAAKLVVGRAETLANGSLRLLKSSLYFGQIKTDLMAPNMDMAQLEALVMPIVTLTGINSNGQTVSTNVSSNEAAFVAGVFSEAVVQSNATLAQAAVNLVIDGLHNGTVAFVLPGVQLILFPIGLIITSIWLAIGLAVIGLGFVQRVSFREQYKERAVRSMKASTKRI